VTAAEIAVRLGLRRARPHEWRGDCPSCGYTAGLVLSARAGRALWWCVSCQDGKAIAAALKGAGAHPERRAAAPTLAARGAPGAARVAAGGPVEAYLAGRGIGLPAGAPIRFLADCPHPSGARLPAMLALVTTADGAPVAIHRTFICADGHGKAAVDPAKATLGPFHGNAVTLHPPGAEIAVGEGIETSLAAAVIFGLPALAALTAGGLAAAGWLPPGVSRVLIAADHDANGAGQRAAAAAARALRRRGVAVRIALPDVLGADFNDVLLAGGAGRGGCDA
jgi:putative DNA primase/helicase